MPGPYLPPMEAHRGRFNAPRPFWWVACRGGFFFFHSSSFSFCCSKFSKPGLADNCFCGIWWVNFGDFWINQIVEDCNFPQFAGFLRLQIIARNSLKNMQHVLLLYTWSSDCGWGIVFSVPDSVVGSPKNV